MVQQTGEKSVTRERLIGMQVIDGDGYLIGTIRDISFTIGKMGISLYIEGKEGGAKEVSWDEVQAVGDFILLKPRTTTETQPSQPITQQPAQPASQICPTCRGPLTWIPQYQRWYCYKCKKYA